jgi:hypothetical protein
MAADEAPSISENVSENTPKRKRGRPPSIDPEMMQLAEQFFPDVRTARGRANRVYFLQAFGILKNLPGTQWLCSTEEEIDAGTSRVKHSILAELGRIADPERFMVAAARLCQLRPTAREAVAWIRSIRLGRSPASDAGRLGQSPASDAESLRQALCQWLNQYWRSHPDLTAKEVTDALEGAIGWVHFTEAMKPSAVDEPEPRTKGKAAPAAGTKRKGKG